MSNYVPAGNQGKAKVGAPATKDGKKTPGMGGVTAGRHQPVSQRTTMGCHLTPKQHGNSVGKPTLAGI